MRTIVMVLEITNANFEAEVLKADKAVLIDFWAPWCGPCRMQGPVVDALAEEQSDFVVAKLNVDEAPALAQQFGVMSIPTIVVMKDGAVAAQAVGVQSKDALLALALVAQAQ